MPGNSPSTTHRLALAAESFAREGWAHLPNTFSADEMAGLDRLIRARYGDRPRRVHDAEFIERAAVDVVPWFPQRDGMLAFDVLESDRRLTEITAAVLGRGWRSDYVMAMRSAPDSIGQAWHQDCPPDRPEHFNLNRLVYLHDITPETGGALVVVPGSHVRELPAGQPHESLPGEIKVFPRAGDLVLVHGHTWHRVGAVGSQARVSVNFRALPATAPDDLTDVCVYRTMRYRFSTATVLATR